MYFLTGKHSVREYLTSSTQQLHKLVPALLPRGREGEKAVSEVHSLSFSFFFFLLIPSRISKTFFWQSMRREKFTLASPLMARDLSWRESASRSVFRGLLLLHNCRVCVGGRVFFFYLLFFCFLPHCVFHFKNFLGLLRNACWCFQYFSVSPVTIIPGQLCSRIS